MKRERSRHVPLIGTITVCIFLWCATVLFAHVAPVSEIGHHIQLRVGPERVIVDYAIVLSDISLAKALIDMETDGVSGISEAERKTYDDRQRERLRHNIEFTVDNQPVPLTDYFEAVQDTPEQVFVYKFSALVTVSEGVEHKLALYNNLELGRDEWLVYYVASGAGITLVDGRRWQKATDKRQMTDKQGERGIELTYKLGTGVPTQSLDDVLGKVGKRDAGAKTEKLKEFIRRPLSLKLVIVALVVSAVLGGLHALTPGHGKAVVAAYLVGSKGRVREAIFLGLVVTLTHTFSVIALGLVTLFASQYVLPQDIAPWLSVASGFLIAVLGTWLLGRNLNQYYHRKNAHSHDHANHSHSHDHEHPPHDHGHEHHDHDHHPLDHEQEHDHHSHDHEHHHGHSHTHSRVPERPGLWGLLSLGVSGGIVPCVDALVGLLFAISMNRIVWGLVIICAFSIGLASVLVAIGVMMVLAKPLIERFTGEGVWLQRLPILSSVVVIILGTVLMFKALNDMGIITIRL